MPLDDSYIAQQIEEDHQQVKKDLDYLGHIVRSALFQENFEQWKLEMRRRLLSFQNLLKQHFELEEEIGFKHNVFIGNQKIQKSVQQFKTEHVQMLALIDELVREQREQKSNDELHRNLLKQKVDQLLGMIKNHEQDEARIISETIREFKEAGRFTQEPTFSKTDLEKFEKTLDYTLPESYKTVVSSGSYDQSTFYFVEPHQHSHHPEYIIFAVWNDINFGFYKNESSAGQNAPVYVLSDEMQPDEKYDDFTDWFHLVFEIANQPINAG